MIKKLLHKLVTIVLINSLCISYAYGEKEDITFKQGKKIIKIVWHCAEIYAGFYIGHKDFHWTCKNESYKRKIVYGTAIASLVVHGCLGLDKELKIVKRVKNFLK